MRCRRCHTKLAPGKKTCPVCGTLILKRRGSVRLATSAGGSRAGGIADALSGIDGRKLLAAIAAIIAIVCIACMIAGCGSCGACSSCSACSSCGSCASCTACSSCGSCTACSSCGSCSSCDDSSDALGLGSYHDRLNGGKMGREFYSDSTLYYVNGENLMSISADGISNIETSGEGIYNLCADEENIYYLQAGNIWSIPKDRPLTVTDDPDGKYQAVRVVNATVSGSDAGVSRVAGFSVDNGIVSYWGLDASGRYNIMARRLGEYSSTLLHSGNVTNVQIYRDCVYYVSCDEADNGILYSVSTVTGEKKAITDKAVNAYVLSKGHAYVCRYISGKNTMFEISLSNGKTKNSWVIGDIGGIIASDNWIYYCINGEITGGDIYRMKPGDDEAKRIFHDDSRIMLVGVAGDYFSVYTNVGATAQDRLTNAVYYIFNAETRDRVM